MKICSINSGSNGNCYYIADDEDAILVDAGVSLRETEKRFSKLNLSLERVRAIFISHEHGDHITGVPGISRKYNIPVYITANTFQHSHIPIDDSLRRSFTSSGPVRIGAMEVTAFTKAHDAADPHSFIVSRDNLHVGVFTDIGVVCDRLIHYFRQCHAAFLESNYCADMLEAGRYPYHLKRRIAGGKGHLSNAQAFDLYKAHRSERLSNLILSHLSSNNNRRELVADLFSSIDCSTAIEVASRFGPGTVMAISGSDRSPLLPYMEQKKRSSLRFKQPPQHAQLSLF